VPFVRWPIIRTIGEIKFDPSQTAMPVSDMPTNVLHLEEERTFGGLAMTPTLNPKWTSVMTDWQRVRPKLAAVDP
jgi:hypothetical protein